MSNEFYSQRLLNPFRGVMNIIEMDEADAVTTDGQNWTLYVHDEADPWAYQDNLEEKIVTPDIKFGTWSEAQGFEHGPVLSTMDSVRIERVGRRLLQLVQQKSRDLPFPTKDHYELWLLDKDHHLPLVLLDSACEEDQINEEIFPCWIPGQRCKREFQSQARLPRDLNLNAAETLSIQINGQAGDEPRAQWFWRDSDGTGFALHGINLHEAMKNRQLPADVFPELLLRTQWLDSDSVDLIYDFLAWQAPWLLLLQNLSQANRHELEQQAAAQAVLTASLCGLYPEVIDAFTLNKIKVEAKLRQALPTEEAEEESIPAFYNGV